MGRIIVTENISLDGVMQAPARQDEDTRGGFEHGGWALPYGDSVSAEYMGKASSGEGAMVLGRTTYEDFEKVWPQRGDHFSDVLNKRHKYVASTTLSQPLAWENSTVLKGDAVDSVAKLKEESGQDLAILGSGVLVNSLLPHGLIDEIMLSIFPLILGSGRRLFEKETAMNRFELTESLTTTTGVIIARYVAVSG